MLTTKPTLPRLRRGHWSTDGLLSHWPFYEGAGDVLHDIAGGNHGTLTGMDPETDWVPSEMGAAMSFDTDDDYVGCGTIAHCPIFTCVAVVRRITTGSAYQGIASHHPAGLDDPSDWLLYFDDDDKLHVDIPWVDGDVYVGNTAITDSNWHTCAMVRTGGVGAWTYTGYIDGVLDDADGTASNPQTTAFEFVVGNMHDATTDKGFGGDIASLSLYSRGLSASEAKWLAAFPNIMLEPMGWKPWMVSEAPPEVSIPAFMRYYRNRRVA